MRAKLSTMVERLPPDAQIRICWPKPDKVCLQSGCSHCADSDHVVSVTGVAWYAEENGLGDDFAYGLRYNWSVRWSRP